MNQYLAQLELLTYLPRCIPWHDSDKEKLKFSLFLFKQSAESCRKASESSTRSVTAEADTSSRRTSTKVKREPATTTTNATTTTAPPTHPQGLSPSEDLRDEPGDFIETNCHWRDCGLEFPTQVSSRWFGHALSFTLLTVLPVRILFHLYQHIYSAAPGRSCEAYQQ